MSLLSDIEKRFESAEHRVVSDVESASRSKIGQSLLTAAKEILPLIPEGREASLVVTKLEEVEAWAHRALAQGSIAATEALAATQTAAADVGIDPPAPEPVAPVEPPAPVAPA